MQQKIDIENFDTLNRDGLQGPPDGLRSVSYEFCIPTAKEHADEVRTIEPAIVIQKGGSGRTEPPNKFIHLIHPPLIN